MKSCTFIGHKDCPYEIKERLFCTVEDLILDKNVTRFYVGTQGRFDKLVYQVLCELEKRYEIEIFVVLAYLNRTIQDAYYDMEKTIFPEELTSIPLRFSIRRRNSFMIDKAEFVVTYMNTSLSNTYNNVAEAVRKKKRIINLGSFDLDNIINQ